MAGSGTLAATVASGQAAAATMVGTGTLAVTTTQQIPTAVTMTGAGTLTAATLDQISGRHPRRSGTLSAVTLDQIPSAVTMSGSGSLSITARPDPQRGKHVGQRHSLGRDARSDLRDGHDDRLGDVERHRAAEHPVHRHPHRHRDP
jgi:hypothetical protein